MITKDGMVKITGRYKELIIGDGGEKLAEEKQEMENDAGGPARVQPGRSRAADFRAPDDAGEDADDADNEEDDNIEEDDNREKDDNLEKDDREKDDNNEEDKERKRDSADFRCSRFGVQKRLSRAFIEVRG